MAAITSAQAGNWSDTATWVGGVVPGDGDTVTQNHNITVTDARIIGTSPNNNTTVVLTINATLTISATGSLTIKGNWLMGANQRLSIVAGGSLLIDASGSGGTPVYRNTGVNVNYFDFVGTEDNTVSVSAPVGHTFSLACASWDVVWDHVVFTRVANSSINVNFGPSSVTNCVFEQCGQIMITSSSNTTYSRTYEDNRHTNTVGSNPLRYDLQAVRTAGVRSFRRNVFDKSVVYTSNSVEIEHNAFLGGLAALTGYKWDIWSENFLGGTGSGTGSIITADISRTYHLCSNETGNSHFIAPEALTSDTAISEIIFEADNPDLIDTGDCILLNANTVTSGRKITVSKAIVLPNSREGTSTTSGTLLTLYNAGANAKIEFERCTVFVALNAADSISPTVPIAALALGEASGAASGQVSVFRSNIIWANTAGNGLIARQLQQTSSVKDVITATGCDYNHVFNLAVGNNGRGYHDFTGTNDLWAAGNAAEAGVDANQTAGNPQFLDATRNLKKWATARGYGATTAEGITALAEDPATRIPDLIDYVFEGFTVQSSVLATSAHDGGVRGAGVFSSSSPVYYITDTDQIKSGRTFAIGQRRITSTDSKDSSGMFDYMSDRLDEIRYYGKQN